MADASDARLAELLNGLGQGDDAAAAAVFQTYEPYLRLVVRRQLSAALRAKFDSADVVQSVWADLLRGFRTAGWQFSDPEHLRAFLVKATRNRFIDRLRRHLAELELEQPLLDSGAEGVPASTEPDPSDVAQAGDMWEQLLAMAPPTHAEVLQLKRRGMSLGEIAAATSLHESSVRRILYDLARKLDEARTRAAGSVRSFPAPTAT
jgi:RNA polymerase sigma-70 factor (ECF subfamily)